MGIRCSNFIDDFIFVASSLGEAVALRDKVLQDMVRLGWFVGLVKSLLVPAQKVLYLGFEFASSPVPHVMVPARRIVAALHCIEEIQRMASGHLPVQGRKVAQLAGMLQSTRFAVQPVQICTRGLYVWLARLPCDDLGFAILSESAPLTPWVQAELSFWGRRLWDWNGARVRPGFVQKVLYTDASGGGWGSVVQHVVDKREEPATAVASEFWEDIDSQDSVFTELSGLHRALCSNIVELAGQSVLHRTDSLSTYWVVANGGSRRSTRLSDLAREIWLFCLVNEIDLSAQYVGAEVIIEKGADLMSRWKDTSDCSLQPMLFALLWRHFGPFTVDLFADGATARSDPVSGKWLPFFARFLQPAAMGMDALNVDWRTLGGMLYAFPPPTLLEKVVHKISLEPVSVVLVAPVWQTAVWWPVLLALEPVDSVDLPDGMVSFVAGQSGCGHPLGPGFSGPEKVKWRGWLLGA